MRLSLKLLTTQFIKHNCSAKQFTRLLEQKITSRLAKSGKNGNIERLKLPEIQEEAPELQYPEDADLLALLNMDGSLDLLNGSLFRF